MDFVAVIGDEFTQILQFVEGAPRLPVKSTRAISSSLSLQRSTRSPLTRK